MELKTCKTCGKSKPLNAFPSRGVNEGFRPHCKPCYNLSQRAWRDDNPDRIRELWRGASERHHTPERRRTKTMRQYGMTLKDFDEMLYSQGGTCKICNKEGPLVVDHCHATGVVRGLLCRLCNLGLGHFEDDVDRLQSAMIYLQLQAK